MRPIIGLFAIALLLTATHAFAAPCRDVNCKCGYCVCTDCECGLSLVSAPVCANGQCQIPQRPAVVNYNQAPACANAQCGMARVYRAPVRTYMQRQPVRRAFANRPIRRWLFGR